MLTVDGEPVYLTTTTSTVEVQEEVHVVTSNDETISRYENSETASELENKSKSLVQNFFKKSDKHNASCQLCSKTYKISGGSTSTLMCHVRNKHMDKLDSYVKATDQPSVIEYLRRSKKYTGSKKAQLDEKVAIMMCKDMRPTNMVEDQGFRDLVSALDPQYVLPTRSSLRYLLIYYGKLLILSTGITIGITIGSFYLIVRQ